MLGRLAVIALLVYSESLVNTHHEVTQRQLIFAAESSAEPSENSLNMQDVLLKIC